jgi:hypothetical protein
MSGVLIRHSVLSSCPAIHLVRECNPLAFFERIPRTEEQWIHLRNVAGLSNADAILCVIDCLNSGRLLNSRSRNASTLGGTSDDLQSDLVSFAKTAGSMLSDTRFNMSSTSA